MNSDKDHEQIESSKIKLENLNDSDSEFYDAPQEIVHEDFEDDDEEEEQRIQDELLRKLDQENQQNSHKNNDFDSTTPAFKNVDSKFQNLNLNKDQDEKFVPLHDKLNKNMQSNLADNEENDGETTVQQPKEIDPHFVDEELLKTQQEMLNDAEKEEKLTESQNIKKLGNEEFKNENFDKALELYTQALRTCPLKYDKERSIFYSNRSACYFKLKLNEKCVTDCSKSIQLDESFVKPLLRRAECYQLLDKFDEALEDYKKLCELEPRNSSHATKCYELEHKIKERNEKLKEEMFGKLKELGNLVLKPFGLSTNNFQFVQDPNTGSYSVNFSK